MARPSYLIFSLAFGALFLSGCKTNWQYALPTAQTVARAGAARGTDVETLARGRKVFATSCTECHVARPIAKYSIEQWRRNIAIMAPRARLKPAQRAALEAYLRAARESLP